MEEWNIGVNPNPSLPPFRKGRNTLPSFLKRRWRDYRTQMNADFQE
jgi:hypothetical protein